MTAHSGARQFIDALDTDVLDEIENVGDEHGCEANIRGTEFVSSCHDRLAIIDQPRLSVMDMERGSRPWFP